MVPTAPEARPKNLFSTLPMIAFVLGEEKRANPKPRMTKPVRRKGIDDP
jgi:hypothetical protein